MDLCEQLGSGMRKILRTYPKNIFHISEHFLDVKFMYDKKALSILNAEIANGGINGGINLEDKENKISLQTDIPVRTVQRIIKSLKEEGIIERVGSKKTGFWKVNN